MVLTVCLQVVDPPQGPVGTLKGLVINQTCERDVGQGTEVVLRVEVDGQFVAVTETTTDRNGSFRFEDLPILAEAVYLPGANRGEVHYPGPRVQLTPDQPHAAVELHVFDEVSSPNPLVIRRHDIVVHATAGALRVTESLQVENPAQVCYVGGGEPSETPACTLRLKIPPDFERATFQSEFFGRRFQWQENALVTRIPWPPGRRDLKFSYVMSNVEGRRRWERSVDLPSDEVQLTVHSESPALIECDALPGKVIGTGSVTFTSNQSLPAGRVIQLHLDGLPVPLVVYLRWLAVLALLGSTAAVCVWLRRAEKLPQPVSGVVRKCVAFHGPSSS